MSQNYDSSLQFKRISAAQGAATTPHWLKTRSSVELWWAPACRAKQAWGPHAAHRRAPTGVGPLVKVNDVHARTRKKPERYARSGTKNLVERRVPE